MLTLLSSQSHPQLKAASSDGPGLPLSPRPSSYGSFKIGDLTERLPTSSQKSQTFRLLSNTTVQYILFARFLRDFIADGFLKLITLWSYTPIPLGGLERNVSRSSILYISISPTYTDLTT